MGCRLISILYALAIGLVYVEAGIFDSIKNVFGMGAPKEEVSIPSGQENLPPYFRFESQIVRLDNQGGILGSGSKCETFGSCDPWVYGYIDTESPTKSFPGSLDTKAIPKIFQASNTNSPDIQQTLTKDACNVKDLSKMKAVLRVHVMDHNKLLSDSLIEDFDCPIGGTVGASEKASQWTDANCVGKKQPKKIKLAVRTRIYRIDSRDCSNARPSSSQPTLKG